MAACVECGLEFEICVLPVTAMRTARPPPTGCCLRQTFALWWASCAGRGSEDWPTCLRTRWCSTTKTSPTFPRALVSSVGPSEPDSDPKPGLLTVSLSCSARARGAAGVRHSEREAMHLHAGAVSHIRGLPAPEGGCVPRGFRANLNLPQLNGTLCSRSRCPYVSSSCSALRR